MVFIKKNNKIVVLFLSQSLYLWRDSKQGLEEKWVFLHFLPFLSFLVKTSDFNGEKCISFLLSKSLNPNTPLVVMIWVEWSRGWD